MGESIAITSGKGGVGKSSTIIGIGMILAQMGYRVCMMLWMANVHCHVQSYKINSRIIYI